MKMSFGQALIDKVKDMQSDLVDEKGLAIIQPLEEQNSQSEELEEKNKGANHEPKTLKKVLIKCNYKWDPKLKKIIDFHGG